MLRPTKRLQGRQRHLRRTLLLLWFPSMLLLLITTGVLLSQNSLPQPVLQLAASTSGSMYAAAPPNNQVLGDSIVADHDARVQILTKYLKAQKSPLANHAGTFVTVADKYSLDWRLLPAIAGKESGFGRVIPSGSHNAWGWGIPTGAKSGHAFSTWDAAIETVGRGLREKYYNRGYDTLMEIESLYTPPSAARPDHPWKNGVAGFMAEIEHTR